MQSNALRTLTIYSSNKVIITDVSNHIEIVKSFYYKINFILQMGKEAQQQTSNSNITPKSIYEKAGFLSKTHFTWIFPLIRLINKKKEDPPSIDEIPDIGKSECVEKYASQFIKNYEKARAKGGKGKRVLFWAAIKAVHSEFLTTLIVLIIFLISRVLYGYFLSRVLKSLSNPDEEPIEAFYWALGLFGCVIYGTYGTTHQYYLSQRAGVALKIGSVSMIYQKINKVSLFSLQKLSLGKVVNLAANDVNIFDIPLLFFLSVICVPFTYFVSGVLLWHFFGVSCLTGLGYMLLLVPLQFITTGSTKNLRNQKHKVTDERVKITNEIIDSIRLLKMYAWEFRFKDLVKELRKKEIHLLKQIQSWEFFNRAMSFSSPYMAAFLIFLTYTQTGNELEVGKVFPTLFITNFLRLHGNNYIGLGTTVLLESFLFFQRVTQILELSEVKSVSQSDEPPSADHIIEFEKYTAYWSEEPASKADKPVSLSVKAEETEMLKLDKPTLTDINLNIKPNSLTAIIGPIGAGKSTLLLSLTGEIPRSTGKLRFRGKIAYVEQEPTIFSGRLRDIILFGQEYDPEFYQKVIEGCCLIDDLKEMAHGDMTEIGEKGVTLSGGQKARVTLARAIYSRSDIYLLDDPLSAVDSKVAKKLFENAIKGLLKDKTVLLVTHQVHFVKDCERIIVMQDGKIIEDGTYEELKDKVNMEQIVGDKRKHKKSAEIDPKSVSVNVLSEAGSKEPTQAEEEEDEFEGEERGEEKGTLFAKEDVNQGVVTFHTYKQYFKKIFNPLTLIIFFTVLGGTEAVSIIFGRVLGYWADFTYSNTTATIVCGVLAGVLILTYNIKNIMWISLGLNGSRKVHDEMIEKIVKSPTEFFDINPVGRILNRFTNDLGILDRLLLQSMFDVLEGFVYFTGIFITLWIANPIILAPGVIIVILYYLVLRWTTKSVKVLRGLELVTRSPIYSQLSLTLSGLIAVRSFRQVENFVKSFNKLVNDNGKCGYYYWTVQRVLGFYIDYSSAIYIIATVTIFIFMKDSGDDTSFIGLAITLLLTTSEYLQWILRQAVTTDMLMASFARAYNYTQLPSEANALLPTDQEYINNKWPSKGEIVFNNVFMRYRQNTDHIIKGLDIKIAPGQKIGCVGRTGAGKSSIIQILFRMVEIDKTSSEELKNSSVKIDGVDTMDLGLHLLRNGISIIPQAPVVFTGSIKRNLDPFGKHPDEELWSVLEEVNLKSYVEKLEHKLDTDMTNATSVFSVGQKQLICLARAILRKNKIIVLDEATANVDFETDNFIQKKIIEKFKDCTIFTIAHRLSTVAHYDKVLVLDKGRKVEFDAPYKLLVKNVNDTEITNTEGVFASMVLHTGPKNSRHIFNICKQKYLESQITV